VLRLSGDDVVLTSFVEARDTLDGHVVGFCGSAGENDFFGISIDEGGDVLVIKI
jgi:hypothetical protein